MKKIIKVGTRESDLAMTQSRWVVQEIQKKYPELQFELVPIKTKGDVLLDTRLDKIGGKGLFIKELENALLDGSIDMAVHSMKDMPAELPEGLTISALSKREDPRDALVTLSGQKLTELKTQAVIGTSSVRREAQLLVIRPDFQMKLLRGNVLTRLNKLLQGEYDGVILAAAGLNRLGLEGKITQYFSIEEVVPAVGQGVLCVETREEDKLNAFLDSVHCEASKFAVDAERAFLIRLNGGCTVPLGAHAVIEENSMKVYGMLASEDRTKIFKGFVEGPINDAISLGNRLADEILAKMRTDC
ncbi:MAG: hydroxymethylbilane synthase [Clostridia bacterium]|nr:hydroxymethylbilane synthase [Clostridia bacterium]